MKAIIVYWSKTGNTEKVAGAIQTGIREAVPAGLYAGQFFEHLGFRVLDEWYVVGEYHGSEEASTQGRLGDIRGRPNEQDLRKVKQDTRRLVEEIMGGA